MTCDGEKMEMIGNVWDKWDFSKISDQDAIFQIKTIIDEK